LDGKLRGTEPDPGPKGFPNADYSMVLDKLAKGSHDVSVIVAAATFYDDPESDTVNVSTGEISPPLTYSRNITETRLFTTNADLPVQSPSPTQTPIERQSIFPTTLAIASAGIVCITIVGIGLFVYFKKRK
jgi:hypothetical protein